VNPLSDRHQPSRFECWQASDDRRVTHICGLAGCDLIRHGGPRDHEYCVCL
jgi:hypothetical protein